jgi:hypothetical protein
MSGSHSAEECDYGRCAARRRPESCERKICESDPSGLSACSVRNRIGGRRGTFSHTCTVVVLVALYCLPLVFANEDGLSARQRKEIDQLMQLERVLHMEEDTVDKLEAMRFHRGRMHALGDSGNTSVENSHPAWAKFDKSSHDCSDVELLSTDEDPYGACEYVTEKCR